jgi:hypothetical protein
MSGSMTGLKLTPAMHALLKRCREAKRPNPYFGHEFAECEESVRQIVDPLLMRAGLGLVLLNEYRWFAREVAGCLRADGDGILAYHLEQVLQKWLSYGLELRTMELLLGEVFNRIEKMGQPEPEILVAPQSVPRTGTEVANAKTEAADTG